MTKFPILKKRRDFLRAAKDTSVVFHNVLLQAARPLYAAEQKPARIGFTATKKLGKAHIRNRTKRRLRAVVSDIYGKYALENIDYVLIGRYDTYCCSYDNLYSDVVRAFKKINKLLTAENEDVAKTSNLAD